MVKWRVTMHSYTFHIARREHLGKALHYAEVSLNIDGNMPQRPSSVILEDWK
jgi:hypothetical protein